MERLIRLIGELEDALFGNASTFRCCKSCLEQRRIREDNRGPRIPELVYDLCISGQLLIV